jgi:hypothetical protein
MSRMTRTLALLAALMGAPGMMSGCAQMVLLGLIIGGPPSIQPEFDRETGKSLVATEKKVVVVVYADPEIKLQYSKIDHELAGCISRLMQVNKIDVAEPDYVRAWIDKHSDWETADEIGEAFEADYVVELELVTFDLYEPHSANLLRGRTLASVNVYDVAQPGNAKVFQKEVNFMYPTKIPRPTDTTSELDFKREFLSRLSEEVGYMFYPSYNGDKIPWAA